MSTRLLCRNFTACILHPLLLYLLCSEGEDVYCILCPLFLYLLWRAYIWIGSFMSCSFVAIMLKRRGCLLLYRRVFILYFTSCIFVPIRLFWIVYFGEVYILYLSTYYPKERYFWGRVLCPVFFTLYFCTYYADKKRIPNIEKSLYPVFLYLLGQR